MFGITSPTGPESQVQLPVPAPCPLAPPLQAGFPPSKHVPVLICKIGRPVEHKLNQLMEGWSSMKTFCGAHDHLPTVLSSKNLLDTL